MLVVTGGVMGRPWTDGEAAPGMSTESSHWIVIAVIALVWIGLLIALGVYIEHGAAASESTSFIHTTLEPRYGSGHHRPISTLSNVVDKFRYPRPKVPSGLAILHPTYQCALS